AILISLSAARGAIPKAVRARVQAAAVLALVGWAGVAGAEHGADALARSRMVAQQIEDRGGKNERVLEVMRAVPRHLFVPKALEAKAYADHPLDIGHGQTISQPYIVAAMTELLDPKPDQKILEIGTGSGYQAAVLSRLVREVYTI